MPNPTSIAGCTLWLDAADTSTITSSSGSVSQWNDKSGNGNNAVQATSTAQPQLSTQNGLTALHNPDNNRKMSSTAALFGGDLTIFFVGLYPGGSPYSGMIYGASAVPDLAWEGSGNKAYWSVNAGTDHVFTLGSNSLAIQEVVWNNASAYALYQTGNAAGSGSETHSVGSSIATIFADPGYCCEIIVYNSALSTANRQLIEGYLAWKWGLQAGLPAGHPYAATPPAGWWDALAGSAAASFAQAGALGGTGAVRGVAPIVVSETGSLLGAAALRGGGTLNVGQSGTIAGIASIAGSAAMLLTPTGTLSGVGSLAGSTALLFAQSGGLSGYGSLAGAAVVTVDEHGSLIGLGTLSAHASVIFTESGSLAQPSVLAGDAEITFGALGNLVAVGTLMGSGAIVFTASATPYRPITNPVVLLLPIATSVDLRLPIDPAVALTLPMSSDVTLRLSSP